MWPACGRRVADRSFLQAGADMRDRILIELSNMGKNNGIPALVYEKFECNECDEKARIKVTHVCFIL